MTRKKILSEDLWTVAEAARNFPGEPLSVVSIYRYIRDGRYGIRLESVKVGGMLFTSKQAVRRFVDKVKECV